MVSANHDRKMYDEAMRSGANGYLPSRLVESIWSIYAANSFEVDLLMRSGLMTPLLRFV